MKTFTKCAFALAALLAGIGAPRLQAGEGRTPISGQTTITAPGSYIVTRDFSYASGNGITIQANNVTLDLNGHTITGPACTAAGETAVTIDTTTATAGIVIRNGRLVAGCNGILSSSVNRVIARIDHVEVGNTGNGGILIYGAAFAEVVNCLIHDIRGGPEHGINIQGGTGAFSGRIADNRVEHVDLRGIHLHGLRAGEVVRNVVVDFGSATAGSDGIILQAGDLSWGAGGNMVAGNTVTALPGGTDDDGIRVNATSPNNLILNNVVNGCRFGIVSQADGTRIERNVVSKNSAHGIGIGLSGFGGTGSFNHLEENQAQANTGAGGCGIKIENGNGHVFRNNNLRGNAVSGACGGTLGTNTDGGGNIL